MFRSLALAALLMPTTALAGSISAPGVIAGPDSGPATADPAAAHYNPAALAPADGVRTMLDVQYAFVRVDATATRNDGIDPNTGEAYNTAQARVQVPAFLLGASWQVIPDRLTLGFAVTDAFVGGGDYRAGEPDADPPYESHQRYAGVVTKLVTIHMIPAIGLTVVDGVHVGGGVKIIYDSLEAIQSADALGSEGYDYGSDTPYATDSVLSGSTSGWHMGWNAGLLIDRWKYAQVGMSYHDNGHFSTEGSGEVQAPEIVGGGNPPANLTFDLDLPPVAMLAINSQVSDKLTVGAGLEYQMWNVCCGDADGDIIIGVTSEDGDPLGTAEDREADGLTVEIGDVQYNPRRLWNSANFSANAGYQVSDALWTGARVGFNQNAVPDYAVSATNLDFQNFGFMLAGRYTLGKHVTLGLSYSKFFLQERVITNSAWNLQNGDERFSPSTPYKASTNGTYSGKVDVVGVRFGTKF